MITLHWPQITYLILVFLGTGISIERHGRPKTGHENCGLTILSVVIVMFLLYQGGFFSQP